MLERLIDRFDKKIDGGKGKMKITTAKEFMKVIANHYEKCKGIYLGAMSGSGMFDRRIVTLKGLPEDPVDRQGVAIMYAVLAAPILAHGLFDTVLLSLQVDSSLSWFLLILFIVFFTKLKKRAKNRVNELLKLEENKNTINKIEI